MKHLRRYKLFESKSTWQVVNNKLERQFEFDDFREALSFINKMSEICESMNHHPEINWTYNKIKLSLSTHEQGDIITDLDYQLSKSIDSIY